MSHSSYYLTPIEPSFQHLSIRPLEQTVKFVCSSLNVTNPKKKNPKAFKMHPQPNKLFQTYQNQLIFRLQVVTTLIKIFRQPFHICMSKVYLYLTRQYNLILLLRATKLVLGTKNIQSKLHFYYKIRHTLTTLNCRIPSPLNIQPKRTAPAVP